MVGIWITIIRDVGISCVMMGLMFNVRISVPHESNWIELRIRTNWIWTIQIWTIWIQFDLTQFDSIWFDLTQFDSNQFDLIQIWFEFGQFRFDLNSIRIWIRFRLNQISSIQIQFADYKFESNPNLIRFDELFAEP